MSRIKSYDVPHKGLRNALCQLQSLAGKTDYTDASEVANLHRLGEDVFRILNSHANEENDVLLAELELRCPGASKYDVDDHEKIHAVQSRLEKLLTTIFEQANAGADTTDQGEEFYLALSEFHGVYLEHTAEEERITQPLLWKHFTDEELAGHRGKIMGRTSPETLLTWFRFIIPAMTHKEGVGLLSGFKKVAPPAFYNEGMAVIKKVLTDAEYNKLSEVLGE